jgi:4-diphosphocytidyl-2-C-methyl-D-erythritol kinase
MTQQSPELRLTAPAKINLGLEVIRRRTDGYHDINTVFAALDFGDELILRSRTDGAIRCRVEGSPELETGMGNLCVRAAAALQKLAGDNPPGFDITLRKRIPMGAGLGGGSSDAAAVLRGGASLLGLDLSPGEMVSVAASIGSDVPFFLYGGIAHATSRGEILEPLDLTIPFAVLLVNPGVHVATPWAYGAVGRTGERSVSDIPSILSRGVRDPDILREQVVNDFEPAVFREFFLLRELKERLYASGALFALMSGSGSTLFGLFSSTEDAERAAGQFKEYWSVVTTII